eukprot:487277_1
MMRQFSGILAIFTTIIAYANAQKTCEFITSTLCVNQINEEGFGVFTNQYAFSMETFKDKVYVGTLNAQNAPLSLLAFFFGLPFPTSGAQIHCGQPDSNLCDADWSWEEVVSNGFSGIGANFHPFNYGVRQLERVGTDYLYAVTANHVQLITPAIAGFQLWRTMDGTNWQIVDLPQIQPGGAQGGFGNPFSISGRGLIAYQDHLYIGVENRMTGAQMWRIDIDSDGDFVNDPSIAASWDLITDNGFGRPFNYWLGDFVEFNGYLYTGTLNVVGLDVYRSQSGDFGSWVRVYDGRTISPFDMALMRFIVYNNKLYFGTMNWVEGTSLWCSQDGTQGSFKKVYSEGYDSRFNIYTWSLEEYNGRLYIGTFNLYGDFELLSVIEPGDDELIREATNSGKGLAGFNSGHYGLRSMAIYNDTLIMGSADASPTEATIIWATCEAEEKVKGVKVKMPKSEKSKMRRFLIGNISEE